MTRRFTLALVLLAFVFAPRALADDAKDAEEALHKRAEAFVATFNKGDAKALAAFFTSDGDMVDIEGHLLKGRKAIEETYRKYFAETKGAKLYIRVNSLRVVRPDLALEDGLTEVVSPGAPPSAARYTVVYTKKDGEWFIESVREAIAVPPTNAEHLQDLAFLVGDWTEDVEKGGSAKASYSWEGHGNFLLNTFDVSVQDISVAGGIQWIGWDAAAKKPRAWSFFFNGGFAEGVWTKDGDDKWRISVHAQMRDGKKITATNVFTKIDADHFSFQFIDRALDGKSLPDDKVVKMKRVK